jgi:O-acetyl-ADP-ribose deacetylase (regulator of RNase III)
LKQAILTQAGIEVQTAYETEYQHDPNSSLISMPPGQLPCKRIFFLKWQPNTDEGILRQSIVDFIWNVIQNVITNNYTTIAIPAIGCGKHNCSLDIVVKTMVNEIKEQLKLRHLPLTVTFVIQSEQKNVYGEFCKQLFASGYDKALISAHVTIFSFVLGFKE